MTEPNGTASGPFPHPASTVPCWRTDLHVLDNRRSTTDLPSECDILIIGAGYAGVTTAYHLLNDNPSPPSIVLLETRQACSGATSRNGGHLRPEVYMQIPEYIKKYGFDMAAEITNFEISHIQILKDLVEKETIGCDFILTRSMDVFLDEEHASKSKAAYDLLVESGLISLKDVQFTPARNAETISGVKGAKACFSFTAAHMWPYKFVMHLLSLAVSRGVNLQTTTPVTSVSPTVDPMAAQGLDSYGEVRAIYSVRASVGLSESSNTTNAYTAGIAPEYTHKIVPCRGVCSRIVGENGSPLPLLSNSYCIRHGPGLYDYLISRPDGSIVVGGARSTFFHDHKTWRDVTNDNELIKPAEHYFDGFMQRTFRGWEDSGAVTEKVWTGIMGYTSDSLPHIGRIPTLPSHPSRTCLHPPPSETRFIAAGFNGHGMPVIFRTTKALAAMILTGMSFEDTDVPAVFQTSAERLLDSRDDLGSGDRKF